MGFMMLGVTGGGHIPTVCMNQSRDKLFHGFHVDEMVQFLMMIHVDEMV